MHFYFTIVKYFSVPMSLPKLRKKINRDGNEFKKKREESHFFCGNEEYSYHNMHMMCFCAKTA